MARALMDSDVTKAVVGYDKSTEAVERFFEEARKFGKSPLTRPQSLEDSITKATNICVISLVNEAQCEEVCFIGEENLLHLMPKDSCVVLTSTVTASWAQKADKIFRDAGVMFVDCPVSGGPARARLGDLTLMASGEPACLDFAKPVLDALAREVHVILGGAGQGSTVKCVHQLLAGVHICAAAEAMAMAAKAGIDVSQLYDIVNGAAGASWMFTDRGKRMLEEDPEVKSALAIFVKDLDIVYAEAKKLACPIPVCAAALQQFLSGQSLGLGKHDDSQVVKVYEQITKVPVARKSDSTKDLPQPTLVIDNDFVNVWKQSIPSSDREFFAFCQQGKINLRLHNVMITFDMTRPPPISRQETMSAEFHNLVWECETVRVYKLSLLPGMSVNISYYFFHVNITTCQATIEREILGDNNGVPILRWTEDLDGQNVGISWNTPTLNQRITNASDTTFVQYIVELLQSR